jgi:hypothetical protein
VAAPALPRRSFVRFQALADDDVTGSFRAFYAEVCAVRDAAECCIKFG